MANKYLRRLLRSGLFSVATHEAASPKLKPLQGLPASYNCSFMQGGSPVSRSRPLQARHCSSLPSSAPSHNSSADEGGCASKLVYHEEEAEKQLARCHSCSRVQGKLQLLKSLLYRPASSHSHLHVDCHSHSGKLHDFAAESRRPWMISSSGHSRSQSKLIDGKRAPKGHVAVYVEAGRERHVVPIAYLSQPHFQALLKQAEKEFGYGQQGPGLCLPCSLSELHHTLHQIRSQ